MDPTSPIFTWDEMIKAALGQGKKISEQGARYEGYMVWINALVLSGGGQILTDAEAGRNARPSLASPAGDKAAEIIGNLARSSAARTGPVHRAGGAGPRHVPGRRRHVHVELALRSGRRRDAVEEGTLDQSVVDDIGWARYPRVFAGQTQRAAARRSQPRDRRLLEVSRRRPRRWSSA